MITERERNKPRTHPYTYIHRLSLEQNALYRRGRSTTNLLQAVFCLTFRANVYFDIAYHSSQWIEALEGTCTFCRNYS